MLRMGIRVCLMYMFSYFCSRTYKVGKVVEDASVVIVDVVLFVCNLFCIHSAFYGTIWTIVFNDSKVFSQLGNISNSPTFKFIGKTPVGRFGVSCLLNSLPIFVIFGVTKTVACSVEKARRKTDKLNDFTGGFISGCTVGLLELNLSKHNQELMKKSSMKNSQQALKSIFGYGLFIGCIYSLLLTPRLPED